MAKWGAAGCESGDEGEMAGWFSVGGRLRDERLEEGRSGNGGAAGSGLLLGEGRKRWLVLRRGKEGLCGEDEDDREGSGQRRRKKSKTSRGRRLFCFAK